MSTHTVVLESIFLGLPSAEELEASAINAMHQISGVQDVEVVSNDGAQITLTYEWVGDCRFDQTDSLLENFGLRRVL